MHMFEGKKRKNESTIDWQPTHRLFSFHRRILYHTSMTSSHPLQSESWAAFRRAMGIDVAHTRYGYLTFHRIPFTSWTIGYFPKGTKPTEKMIGELTTLGRKKNAIFIQLEPNAQKGPIHLPPSHHPLFTKYTYVLDLTKSEEELLKAMHPKTRYNLKVAQKHGVIINEDNTAIEIYMSLMKETTGRQGFYAHDETYHRTMWNIMNKAGMAHLFTATYHGQTLAAWIIFALDKTIYYPYGASSREHREVMAPTLMLWEIARWGKKNGYTSFDLWGALGINPDPKDPWFGFHRFKQGFAPTLIEFVGSYDLIINPLLYNLYKIVDRLRWFILHIWKSNNHRTTQRS